MTFIGELFKVRHKHLRAYGSSILIPALFSARALSGFCAEDILVQHQAVPGLCSGDDFYSQKKRVGERCP